MPPDSGFSGAVSLGNSPTGGVRRAKPSLSGFFILGQSRIQGDYRTAGSSLGGNGNDSRNASLIW